MTILMMNIKNIFLNVKSKILIFYWNVILKNLFKNRDTECVKTVIIFLINKKKLKYNLLIYMGLFHNICIKDGLVTEMVIFMILKWYS